MDPTRNPGHRSWNAGIDLIGDQAEDKHIEPIGHPGHVAAGAVRLQGRVGVEHVFQHEHLDHRTGEQQGDDVADQQKPEDEHVLVVHHVLLPGGERADTIEGQLHAPHRARYGDQVDLDQKHQDQKRGQEEHRAIDLRNDVVALLDDLVDVLADLLDLFQSDEREYPLDHQQIYWPNREAVTWAHWPDHRALRLSIYSSPNGNCL